MTTTIDLKSSVDDLVLEYKTNATLTHLEKAQIEEAIWVQMHSPKDGVERRDLLKEALGIKYNTSETHSVLLRSGPLASPIWPMLDKNEITLHEASELMRVTKLKWKGNRHLRLETVLEEVMEVFKSRPDIPVVHLERLVFAKAKQGRPQSTPNPEWKENEEFWKGLKSNLSKFLEAELEGMNPLTAHDVKNKVEAVIREAIQDAKAIIYREMTRTKTGKGLESFKTNEEIEKVEDACHLLGIRAPSPGAPVDLNKAKQKKRALSMSVATDRNAVNIDVNSEKYRLLTEKHQAVLAAYKLLELYNESLSS